MPPDAPSTALPRGWAAPAMKTSEHDHRVGFDDVKEGIRDRSQENSTHVRMNGRVCLWIACDEAGNRADRFEESLPESGFSFLVPVRLCSSFRVVASSEHAARSNDGLVLRLPYHLQSRPASFQRMAHMHSDLGKSRLPRQ